MRRHDLITLRLGAMPQQISCCTSTAAERHIMQWVIEQRQFVYPRQTESRESSLLALAFVDHGIKHRTTFRVQLEEIGEVNPPYLLKGCLSAFAASDVIVLHELMNVVKTVRVFGSVSWEKASGMTYRHVDSDLDLLCDVSTMAELDHVISALEKANKKLSFKLDGEIRFPNHACVHWQELQAAKRDRLNSQVLVKDDVGVYLVDWAKLASEEYFQAGWAKDVLAKPAKNTLAMEL